MVVSTRLSWLILSSRGVVRSQSCDSLRPVAMTVHLLKMCVGIEDVEHLKQSQSAKMAQSQAAGRNNRLWHRTRHMPKRDAEVLGGGSIYWIIKSFIRVRQRIIGLEAVIGGDGIPRCDLILDPELVRTEPQPRRPHQGWRYLAPASAPKDLDLTNKDEDIPEELVIELGEIGLI